MKRKTKRALRKLRESIASGDRSMDYWVERTEAAEKTLEELSGAVPVSLLDRLNSVESGLRSVRERPRPQPGPHEHRIGKLEAEFRETQNAGVKAGDLVQHFRDLDDRLLVLTKRVTATEKIGAITPRLGRSFDGIDTRVLKLEEKLEGVMKGLGESFAGMYGRLDKLDGGLEHGFDVEAALLDLKAATRLGIAAVQERVSILGDLDTEVREQLARLANVDKAQGSTMNAIKRSATSLATRVLGLEAGS